MSAENKSGAVVCGCAACVRTARLTGSVCALRESRTVKDELLDAVYDLWKLERVALLCSAGDAEFGREGTQGAQK